MLLDLDAVYDIDSLDKRLAQFSDYNTAEKLAAVLPHLLDRPLALELVIAATDAVAECILTTLLSSRTFSCAALNGCYSVLLRRLADVPILPLLAATFHPDTHQRLMDCRTKILEALNALQALDNASFPSHEPNNAKGSSPDDRPDIGEVSFLQKRETQGMKKRAQRAAASANEPAFAPEPFDTLAVSVPTSQTQAESVREEITRILNGPLEYIRDNLRSGDSVAVLKEAYLALTRVHEDDKKPNTCDVVTEEEADNSLSSASPTSVDPVRVKVALYSESVKELGPWRVLMSSRAQRNLRTLHRGDKNMFRIVMKKLKELSEGHFSDDNHKKLTGKDVAIPIYEAKMTSDTRLVYRVDCIPEYDDNVETQVLCVYGVYTHAELSRGTFWKSVGNQLAKRGPEYRQRCTVRHPVLKGDKVYNPASFPAMQVPEDAKDTSYDNIAIPEEDLDELHTLLVLEKFVVFSQALLNSIIADVDVTHPFNPSPDERQIIEHPFSCYVISRSGTGKTTTILFKMLGREGAWSLQKEQMCKPRQLFVTQSRVFAGRVQDHFCKLIESLEASEQMPKALRNRGLSTVERQKDLLDVDDDNGWASNLPKRFSELRDEHFPLFTTYDQLCKLIEADVAAWPTGQDGAMSINQRNVDVVNYNVFRSAYWPHFSERLTKGLDSALVYSEIMGVIKGSEESLQFQDRQLDQAAYENFSARRQSTFAMHRRRVYEIFTTYSREKKANRHIDVADRTHTLLQRLQENDRILGRRVDYLYVDEVQDNLLIDALLLRTICSNPHGLFWAGDTAQTISVGSSFRFNDLKAFLHRVEAKHGTAVNGSGGSEPPNLFQLRVNYRSHGGIISCAQTVISLISQFWPDSIDRVAEERGVVDGTKPVFFAARDQSAQEYKQFLFGTKNHDIEFGAHQCIIVRTPEAQAKLKQEIGEIGLIMTVYESKGLEFDDVLLYNFFDDSAVTSNQWRVVLNMLAGEPHRVSAPDFDATRHAGVCAELKSLYVAITRARKNLWIVDCSKASEPMRLVWTARDVVRECTLNDISNFAVPSTTEEWEEQAETFFTSQRYDQARQCFEKAGQPHKAATAKAYYLRQEAEAKPQADSKSSQDYTTAAGAFFGCATATSSSNDRERCSYYRIAGEYFHKAGEAYFKVAAECFEKAAEQNLNHPGGDGLYIRAATLYYKLVDFDSAVRIIRTHNLETHPEVAPIITAAKRFYFGRDDTPEGYRLLENTDEAIENSDSHGLDVAQAAEIEHMGEGSGTAAASSVNIQVVPEHPKYAPKQSKPRHYVPLSPVLRSNRVNPEQFWRSPEALVGRWDLKFK